MDIAAIVGAGGGLGILGLVIIYLLASNRTDRQQYEESIRNAELRADAAETRLRAANTALDDEIRTRRAAEARADRLARQIDERAAGGGP